MNVYEVLEQRLLRKQFNLTNDEINLIRILCTREMSLEDLENELSKYDYLG